MDDHEPTINTTAFLFGNINRRGQLEAEDEDLVSLNRLSDCQLEEINNTIDTLFSQQDGQNENVAQIKDISKYENIEPVDFYDEIEFIEETKSHYNDEDDYDECMVTEETKDAINKMPPPSDVPYNIHNKKNMHDKMQYANQPHCQSDNLMFLSHNENVNTLNTPLGSILPPEYANVNIQTLFPHYHPEKIPRWSKLFKAFHQPQLYRSLDQWKLTSTESLLIDMKIEKEEYIYDEYGMNLGIMPPIEMMKPNDADLFSVPAKCFADCEVPIPFRDIQLSADNTNLIQTNHISNRADAANNFQKRTKFQQEMKRKRKRDDKNRIKGNDGTDQNVAKIEVLIGLTWRDGPASYWYDMYNVPLEENVVDYRIKPCVMADDEKLLPIIKPESLKNDDCSFSTWQLVSWETDIIIDPQSVKNQIMESNKKYACHAGWIPSIKHRNMATFQDAACSEYFGIWPASSTGTMVQRPDISQWHSVFAPENAQMIAPDWVTKIITDPRHQNAQEPYLLELDLNNECVHFDFTNPLQTREILTSELNSVYLSSSSTAQQPTVETSSTENADSAVVTASSTDTPNKEKQLKKMKILSKLSEVSEVEEKPKEKPIEPIENESLSLVQYSDRDTYVVVRDQVEKPSFFMDIIDTDANADTTDTISPLVRHGIQHSLSAIQLDPAFFPLKLDNQFLRHMHRSRLDNVTQSMLALFHSPQPIHNLIDVLKSESEQRQKLCRLTGSGDLFFMRSINDLSACTDHIILAEYSEEYPPLMMQTGMASRIINYLHGHSNQSVIMPQLPYGELNVCPQIPFLGQLMPNQIFQAFENNMFRAPIYPHKLRSTDFLVIIKQHTICIRRVDDVFLVGQELPLNEVPAPNSKKANTFLKDFLQVQIIRMFLQSQSEPKRIKHDEIKAMFSEQSDSALKKRLKIFAEYKKADTGNNGGYWVLKPEFQLPTEDELIELITPEECCSYYSMMWGLCRLEDAGYNSKSFIQADPEQQDDDEEKESNLKIEDEVKAAPWHTTKTFLDAQKGKCYLELIGATEPTGCGEGFSYARVSAKGSLFKDTLKNKVNKPAGTSGTLVPGLGKRMVTGTDADLRKLTLKKAYALLKECGISEHDSKKLKRWDIIDLVRQMSTQKANQGEEEAMIKFARSSKMTVAGQEERYKSECQRIFNLQNQVLANEEELTSDDGGSEDDDENCDDLRKSMYSAVPDDELELFKVKPRRCEVASETNSVVDGDANNKSYTCPASADNARAILKYKTPVPKTIPKALCIRRQVEAADGTKVTHTQTIPWSSIVKIYFKMNQEHKPEYLRTFCGLNHSKEEEKKARRKQQDKIRRLKRQQKQKLHHSVHCSGIDPNKMTMKKKYRPKVLTAVQLKAKLQTTESLANIKCGACGKKGHMRTNKECPLYGKSVKKAFCKRQMHRSLNNPNETIFELLNPNKADPSAASQELVKSEFIQMNHMSATENHNDGQLSDGAADDDGVPHEHDYDTHHHHHHHQESSSMHDIDEGHDSSSGLKLVIPKQLIAQYSASNAQHSSQPSYEYKHKNKTKMNKDLIAGTLKRQHSTAVSKKAQMLAKVPTGTPMMGSKQNEYMIDQKMRGNRRRIDPRVALNHQFEEIYKGLLQVTGYRCFLHPVRKRECPSYYSIIENPMDLSTVKMKINQNSYETRESFLKDIKLIYDNCIQFNGESNEYTIIAKELMSHVMEQFCAKERKLMRLERLVNPLMDEDDMVGMRYILDRTVTAMEEVEHSRPFHTPVDKKKYPDYHDRIPHPMDLQTLRANIKTNKYRSRDEFMADAMLILTNCIAYNGDNSLLSGISQKLIETAQQIFNEREETFLTLEANLKIQFDDASDIAASSCMTDHLSHMGEEQTEDMTDILDLEPCKRRRLSEQLTEEEHDEDKEDDKPLSMSSGSSVDPNRERLMADLQLTDSDGDDDDDEKDRHQSYRRNVSESDNLRFPEAFSQPVDHSETSNHYYYQTSENNSEIDESPNVKFYISDDD